MIRARALPGRVFRAVLPILTALLWLQPLSATAQPLSRVEGDYVLSWGAVPQNAAEAISTIDSRRALVIHAAACRYDYNFWARLWSDNPAQRQGEDFNRFMLAKFGLLAGLPSEMRSQMPTVTDCGEAPLIKLADLGLAGRENDAIAAGATGLATGATDVATVNANLAGTTALLASTLRNNLNGSFGPPCARMLDSINISPWAEQQHLDDALAASAADRPSKVFVQLRYRLDAGCLRAQVNAGLMAKERIGLLGSSGLPCINGREGNPGETGIKIKTVGEWDVDERDLIRILFLHNRSIEQFGSFGLLDPPTAKKLREDLITVPTWLGPEEYSPLGCGNQDYSTGNAQDRLEQGDWLRRAVKDVGDVERWWVFRFLLTLALWMAGGGLLAAAQQLFPAAVVGTALTLAPVLVPIGDQVRIPETENHLLMIRSTQYLNNQRLLVELARDFPDEDASSIRSDQDDVRNWLMEHLRTVFHDDFREYNARPYQRYSLLSLLNLFDFAADADVRNAARLVLDDMAAKAAVASNQSVRIVPHRRRRSAGQIVYFCERADGAKLDCPSMVEITNGGDYWAGLLQAFTGQTQLSNARLTLASARELSYLGTTAYAPPPAALALAVPDDQSTPRFQVRRHVVPEVTFSTRSFLLTAGSVTSAPANKAGYNLLVGTVPIPLTGSDEDAGTGVPTTLQLRPVARLSVSPTPGQTLAPDGSILANLLRIHGHFDSSDKHDWLLPDGILLKSLNQDATPSFDDNLCVFRGFACGINIGVPQEMRRCLVPDGSIPDLSYFDSSACSDYQQYQPTYVALWMAPCSEDDEVSHCRLNRGFFEAFDARWKTPDFVPFDTFRTRVHNRNVAKVGTGFRCRDTYVMGETGPNDGPPHEVAYRCDDEHGVRSVSGADQPDFKSDHRRAWGDVLGRGKNGYLHWVVHPESGAVTVLDWSDAQHPKDTP